MKDKPFIHKRDGEWRVQLPAVGFSPHLQLIRHLPSHPAAVKVTDFYLRYRTRPQSGANHAHH